MVLAAAPEVCAEGTIRYTGPGAHFNQAKLEKVTEFLQETIGVADLAKDRRARNRPDSGSAARTSITKPSACRDVVSKTPITDKTIFRPVFADQGNHFCCRDAVDPRTERSSSTIPFRSTFPSFANVKVGVEKKAEDGTKNARTGGTDPADYRPRPAASYLRHHLWLLWRQSGAQGLQGSQHLCGRFRPLPNSPRRIAKPAAAQPARAPLWQYGHFHRHPWRGSWRSCPENHCSRSRGKCCSIRSA